MAEETPSWAKAEDTPPAWAIEAAPKVPPAQKEEKPLSWGGAAVSAVGHIPQSAFEYGRATIQPFIHFIDTAAAFKDIGKGTLQKLGLMSGKDAEPYADAVGKFLKSRYGSTEAVKHTLATDPVGLAGDLSLLLSGGSAALVRGPGIAGKIGEVAGAVGSAIDPLNVAGKMAGGAMSMGRKYTGDYLTQTGERPLSEAYQAGKAGGSAGADFQAHLRQFAPMEESVEEARRAVDAMTAERGNAYRSGMVAIKNDKSILDFSEIDAAIAKRQNIGQYKGVSLDTPGVAKTRADMMEKINEWRALDPAEFHTPEGFDALKKSLGYVLAETERGSPARLVANDIYKSVVGTIEKQAPVYAKVMRGYEDASSIIKEVERELSLRKTGRYGDVNVGTAMKKLQSTMSNNVHTNYGNREQLAELLVQNGATNLMQKLGGDALSSWTSRGFGRAIGGGGLMLGIGEALLGHPQVLAEVLMALPFTSPRLLGETAYYAGKMSEYVPSKFAVRSSFQVGRVGEEETRQTKKNLKLGQVPFFPHVDLSEVQPRAQGGLVEAGKPYVVGEHGPEVIQPTQSGQVLPAQQMAG